MARDNKEYREAASYAAREAGWTVRRFSLLFVGVVVALSVLGFALNSLGLFGRTVVERKVFENSYQKTESLKQRIATDEAALIEIEGKLQNPNLDEDTRFNLKAQASAIRMRLNAAKAQQ